MNVSHQIHTKNAPDKLSNKMDKCIKLRAPPHKNVDSAILHSHPPPPTIQHSLLILLAATQSGGQGVERAVFHTHPVATAVLRRLYGLYVLIGKMRTLARRDKALVAFFASVVSSGGPQVQTCRI